MGRPACLPDFRTLADLIAEGMGVTRCDTESDDSFLGRLQNGGVRVHERAARILKTNRRGDTPRPTGLHRNLLRLFPEPERVCIVTTNFDLLFEDAAQDLFPKKPELFKAPALPLGREFNGIVHVHGCRDQPHAMVLTDADFGRAYLTDAWASRFLVELFRSSTVMFVGYSHSDTVMKYLTRALPESDAGKRFALTDDVDEGRWKVLGIEPIYYPKDNHDQLCVGIRELADYARRGLLDWRHEIVEIAQRPPSPDEKETGTIREALSDVTKARFFTEAATGPEWLDWLDKHGFLDPLFAPVTLRVCDAPLSAWLVDNFAFAHPEALFLLIGRHNMGLNPSFWHELAQTLAYRIDPPLTDETLSRWVSCLLTTAPPLTDMHVLLSLGQRCIPSGLVNSMLEIFDAMARHGLCLRPPFLGFNDELAGHPDLPQQDIDLELSPEGDNSAINELWESGLKPRLNVMAEPLLSTIVGHLAARHRTFLAWQKADPDWDPESIGRDAIKPDEQDHHYEHVDTLIDAAHDCLQWLTCNNPEVAGRWCGQLTESQTPLLRRLGVCTLSLRTDLTACEKLDWLFENVKLHDEAAEHELSRLMQDIYPQLDPKRRKQTIKKILAFRIPDHEDQPEGRPTAQYQSHWLRMLQESDPGCTLARTTLDGVNKRFPELASHDQPAPTSLWTIETLLSSPAHDRLDELLSFQQERLSGPNRLDLLATVTLAAQREFGWGADLAQTLADRLHWDTDLWISLFRAWHKAKLSDEQVGVVFKYLGESGLSHAHAARSADLLLTWLEDADVPIPHDLLSQANEIAFRLWTFINDRDIAPAPCSSWHSLAIGQPAGILARYWLKQRSILRDQPDAVPQTIFDEVHAAFSMIVQDSTAAGRQGSAILAGQLAFLVDVEEQWTRENLIPRFSKNQNSDNFQAVWDGFLTNGRLTPQVGELMKHAFWKALPHILDRNCRRKLLNRVVDHYTLMLAHFADDPVDKWVPPFFAHASDNARNRFASEIQLHLRHLDDAQQREWWERWLKRYWTQRLEGVPKPLNDGEIRLMFSWLPAFGSLFTMAVELALGMPSVPLSGSLTIHDLCRGNHKHDHPKTVAKLLIHLGEHASPDSTWDGATSLIKVLLSADLPQNLRRQLCELLAKL